MKGWDITPESSGPSIRGTTTGSALLTTPHRYIGYQSRPGDPEGLILAEANLGNLQVFIDQRNGSIKLSLRLKWCLQTAEAVTYIHERGVIHSDLRLENILVHASATVTGASLDLLLCDFGGSTCEELNLDGGRLPEDPFYDPNRPRVSTIATDIFSLGSIFYTILTGRWPLQQSDSMSTAEDKFSYQRRVNFCFRRGQFPDVSGMMLGEVVMGCWTHKYLTAGAVLRALYAEL